MADWQNDLNENIYNVDDAIAALQDDPERLDLPIVHGLSDMTDTGIASFQPVWNQLKPEQRHRLLTHLVDVCEMNFEFDYRALGHFALQDNNSDVRAAAIDLLWEDEAPSLLRQLLHLSQWDTSETVRAAATREMGRFVLLAEYGKLNADLSESVRDIALQIWNNPGESSIVRRRALEAISNSSHESLPDVIFEAYNSSERDLIISAVYAMGKSCDERWTSQVLKELTNDDPEIRFEASRASGELEIAAAIPTLTRIAQHDEREIREVAIEALGEIGGPKALKSLEALLESAEDEIIEEAIEDAIANASLGDILPDMLGDLDPEAFDGDDWD